MKTLYVFPYHSYIAKLSFLKSVLKKFLCHLQIRKEYWCQLASHPRCSQALGVIYILPYNWECVAYPLGKLSSLFKVDISLSFHAPMSPKIYAFSFQQLAFFSQRIFLPILSRWPEVCLTVISFAALCCLLRRQTILCVKKTHPSLYGWHFSFCLQSALT